MTCACGMDSVGTCLVCRARLCADHALRGSALELDDLVRNHLGVSSRDLRFGAFPISLNGVRSDLRPLFRFPAQRQAFYNGLVNSGVICWNCRVNGACEAAGATPQPTAPALVAGGSQRLRAAVAAYLLGDAVTWDSMASDAAVKDTLLQDLVYLAREKAERIHVPVEWEARGWNPWHLGKVRATEEVFHVVDVTVYAGVDYNDSARYETSPRYMNRHGQWCDQGGYFRSSNQVIVKKRGWFSPEERVFRASWSDEPPQPGLQDILKRAAELLAPAA